MRVDIRQSASENWNELGPDKFEFEILDQMEPTNDPSFDAKRELNFMEEMWLGS
jgi:hypothetical protein